MIYFGMIPFFREYINPRSARNVHLKCDYSLMKFV